MSYPRILSNHSLCAVSLLAVLALFAPSSEAAEVLKPQIGVALRDAAVTWAPNSVGGAAGGTYYLTGTTAWPTKDGTPDFHHNQGARVWKSQDLKTWEDLGFVWDFLKHSNPLDHKGGDSWETELYPVPGLPPGERGRAMTAPRLTFDDNRFWLTFSVSGYAGGLLVSDGASVNGPWFNAKKLIEAGGAESGRSDASMFVDKDGTRYLVWGGGCLAKLKSLEDLTSMRENINNTGFSELGVEGPVHFLPAPAEKFFNDGLPERGAPYGVSVFLDGERYAFLFSATTHRDGGIHEDSYICHAGKLTGPYSRPKPFILDSGRCTAFTGPDRKSWVSYSNVENQPALVGFPAATPKVATTRPSAPKRGEVVTKIPMPTVSRKPKDVPQLIEMSAAIFDHPLRDAALCFGPDGTAYLVGTEATRDADGKLDWANNNGIRLWKSLDLQKWEDSGYVWDCDTSTSLSAGKEGTDWHKESHLDVTVGAAQPRIGRAITAPEIHYAKGSFYIVYSLNGQGIGILKSESGKAEGPYRDLGRIIQHGRDGSLFVDGEDVYLVWGAGLYAKLNEDLTKLDGPVRPLFTNVKWFPRYKRRMDVMGQWGSHLVKAGDWYIWTFTTRTGRGGINAIDTMASWSKSLEGPWCEPCMMLPNGGQTTLTAGPDGRHFATVNGEDEHSQHPFLPGVTEVRSFPGWSLAEFRKGGVPLAQLWPHPGGFFSQFYGVQGVKATELDYGIGHPDFLDGTLIRDVWMDRFDDGFYYVSGSFWDVQKWNDQVPFFRSKDKIHWEAIPGSIMSAQKMREFPGFHREEYDKQAADLAKSGRTVQLIETHAYQFEGNTYATTMVVQGTGYLLKSRTNSMNGPFDVIGRAPFAEFLRDDDGSYLCSTMGAIQRYADLAAFEGNKPTKERHIITASRNLCYIEDSEVGIKKIDGKYVTWCTDWSGNYDMNYIVSNSIEGPWTMPRVAVPHGGNGFLFHDDEGWWHAYFNNVNDFGTRAGNFCSLNITPLYVGWKDGELIMEPKAVRANRARLDQLGALWHSPSMEANKTTSADAVKP